MTRTAGKSRKPFIFLLPLSIILTAAGIWLWEAYSETSYLRASEPVADGALSGQANPHTGLSVPTCITKIEDTYFIVDCYHDQILYSDSLSAPIRDWRVMTDQLSRGHTLAGDGVVYLADDTENHSILVFEKEGGGFRLTQSFPEIGVRPHFVVYDEKTELFYALSSMTGEIFVFDRLKDSSRVVLRDVRRIEKLSGVYVRSFTILEDEIYFVSGNSSIIRARLSDLQILEEYPVGPEIAGMVQLARIGDYFYITVSTDAAGSQEYATILRTRDLHGLAEGGYEDVYSTFIGGGTPYYIGSFDGHYYLTEHRLPGHSIWQFDVSENQIENVKLLY